MIRSEAFQDHPYDGYVSRLMPIANRSKGSIPVRVKVLIPRELVGVHLKPDMGAIVAFYKKSDEDTSTAVAPANKGAVEGSSPGEISAEGNSAASGDEAGAKESDPESEDNAAVNP